jgi:hypothetical protein
MSERERVEARNVSMYPDEWEAIDRAAGEQGFVTSRGPNTSLMLRQIVRSWQQAQRPQPAELESTEC